MLELTGVEKSFGATPVLRGVDLRVRPGTVTALIGPSGSGKSTLLRCVNLLERPQRGTVRLGDLTADYARLGRGQAHALRGRTGMVFQGFHLFRHRTVVQNVAEGPIVVSRRPRAEAYRQAAALLDRVGLADRADFYPAQLSGGQQQRAAIARAMAMDPDLLLFDEPTSALDPESSQGVLAVVQGLAAQGRTMVLVTHEIAFARRVADTVAFLADGQVLDHRPTADFFEEPAHPRIARFLRAHG